MRYAALPVTVFYYCTFLIYYRGVANSKRKNIWSLLVALTIISLAYYLLGHYKITAFSLPVILPLMVIIIKTIMGINFLKSVFGAVTCVLSAYCARGIVAAILSFIYLNTNPNYISKLSTYITATVIGLPLMLMSFQILRKVFFSDYRMREFLSENHYVILVVGYGIVASANFFLINIGRVNIKNEAWYTAIMFGACFLTIGMLIVSVYYCIKINHLNEFKIKNHIISAQFEKQKQYYTSYQKQQNKYKAFLHDYNAIVTTLKKLVVENRNIEAQKVMDSLDVCVRDVSISTATTGNAVLDCMLQDLNTICEQNEIPFRFIGGAPSGTQLELTDAIRIFYNLTSNAVEANLKIEKGKRYININSWNNKDWAILEISNPYTEIIYKANNLATTKKEKDKHGFGLQNVKEIVAIYNGFITFEDSDKDFKVIIHIPKL